MECGRGLIAVFVLFNVWWVNSTPLTKDDATKCVSACQELDEKKVNVHLVPHSHDDVGWLQTFEGYYKGTGDFKEIKNAGVQYILDSTIQALQKNKNRRYIQVETAFFWKWWNNQDEDTRSAVRDLVNSGQLEMVGGGWSMNDEAAAHYQSIIDQFTWGFRILDDTVGECGRPKVGWQIDPFGHSREHASISKQLGFEGLVLGRIDYRDKSQRIEDKNLDFNWVTNPNFEDSTILTTMFPDFYTWPEGLCLDSTCASSQKLINDDNVEAVVANFTAILQEWIGYYKTKNILIPMGHDFTYQKAEDNFNSMDKLIEGFKDSDYNVIYSTPSCYIEAVTAAKPTLTKKEDDFFPYASNANEFWTGYFTSRPTAKRFERVANNILQSVKQLTTFSRIQGGDYDKNIVDLRMAMGVMQHHDAITGTEKQDVANDYTSMLYKGIAKTQDSISKIISDLLKKKDSAVDLALSTCLLANVTICDASNKDKFLVAVQNPLSKTVSHHVRLPVNGTNFKITDADGEVAHDVLDAMHTFDFETKFETPSKEIVFLAKDLPPLGVKLYYVETVAEDTNKYHPLQNITGDVVTFGDAKTTGFTIDATTGKLASVTIKGVEKKVQQDFYYYHGRVDGAYVFKPEEGKSEDAKLLGGDFKEKKYVKGDLVEEVHQVISDEATQVIRVYKTEDDAYVEFDWLIGNLQLDKNQSKEVITRFTIDGIANKDIFYTDANGRQQVQRTLNKRSDYEYDATQEPISSNYYPVTSKIVVKDETAKTEVAVLNDRAQGGSVLEPGVIELMVHRKEVADDHKGVDEVLNEKQFGKGLYARGQHYLTFGSSESKPESGVSTAAFERDLAHKKLLAPLVLVADATGETLNTVDKVKELVEFEFKGLAKDLPDNVQILTLEPWKDSYILRLEHILEKGEDDTLSTAATVDLAGLFTLFNITELSETTLGANQLIEAPTSKALKKIARSIAVKDDAPDLKVTLNPMEIKTFIFTTDKTNDGGHDNGITDGDDTSSSRAVSAASILIVFVTSLYALF
jgi:lysosomal alpha-mannosidase